jgi:aminopeptidase
MFDGRKYYAAENAKIEAEYRQSISKIDALVESGCGDVPAPFGEFLVRDGRQTLSLCAYEEKIGPEYFRSRPVDDLLAENRSIFAELEPDAYGRSYADPARCAAVFGSELGPYLSNFHVQFRQHIAYAFRHQRFEMLESHRRFLEAADCLRSARPDLKRLKEVVTYRQRRDRTDEYIRWLREQYSPDFDLDGPGGEAFAPEDPRYLFLSGLRVSTVEIDTARFVDRLPEEEIAAIARSVAAAYARGFVEENKDRTGKTVCNVQGSLGQERIYRRLGPELEKEGFRGVLKSLSTPPLNRQYWFDHRFDDALSLTAELVEERLAALEAALASCRPHFPAFSGTVWFDAFGEEPFTPKLKSESAKFTEEQRRLIDDFQRRRSELHERYLPRTAVSFTGVAFPSTEIGKDFQAIFREMIAINSLDPDRYAALQQKIIDVLDASAAVRIVGKDGNRTDLVVRLRRLADPAHETNFVNCGADINIPLGEVFTTPALAGTNGTLHVKESFLFDCLFRNLTLEFRDGYVAAYGCSNHATDEENRRYIEEYLLFPHQTLPLGEFAIGTNTRAFAMSRRFGILEKMPVLVIEKMGPHFAIGDTCFSREEDHPTWNRLTGKKIVAKDNEKSILRKTEPANAYTHKHIDITLPFGEIGRISAVAADGRETDVIRNGEFVLAGTEELNEPLKKITAS